MANRADDLFRYVTPEQWCTADLLAYTCAMWPQYQIGRHHALIAQKLEDVARGKCKRLLIMAPPRHGKTLLVSQFFPPWFMGREREASVIYATYAQDRANDVGRAVRDVLMDETHRIIFGQKLRDDSKAVHRFQTDTGAQYFAVGVGGPVTGRGADVFIIDDPHKGRKDASSETMQRRAIQWYSSVAYTRLHPGAAIVMILTRWDERDLAGQILERGGEDWEIIRLPALAEDGDILGRQPGEALWPERYSAEELERIRSVMLPADWMALYQQAPTAADGDLFRREWVRRYKALPKDVVYYVTADYAVTEGAGDYTEIAVWAVDTRWNLYAVDWWYGREDSSVWSEKTIDTIRYKPLSAYSESGVIRRAVEPWLRMRMRQRQQYIAMQWLPTIGDKTARVRSFQARMAAGQVYWPETDWADRVIDQLMRFPHGRYDDAVDACGLMGRAMDARAAHAAKKQGRTGLVPFTQEWLEYEEKREVRPF